MGPPVYETLAADTACATLLTDSDGRLRVFPHGEAPQAYTRPYVVHQIPYGGPDNTLADTPDSDLWGVQIDVYGPTADSVATIAAAVRAAVEQVAYVARYNGTSKEAGPKNDRIYRYSFDVDWRTNRA